MLDWKKITHLIYWLTCKKGGLLKLSIDVRDFKLGKWFGAETYVPKHQVWELEPISIKDQRSYNTCVFNSGIAAKEIDEKVKLSVRGAVTYAKRQGLISGNGFSNLRSFQKILQEWGAQEEGLILEYTPDWNIYSNAALDNVNAGKHKIGSFWSVDNKDEIYKALDEGHPIYLGMLWYSGFNQGGGFSSPWLITKSSGYSVGGHAVYATGYNLNYQGRKVLIIRNSYGDQWGDKGRFYMDIDYALKEINNYGAYVNLDVGVDLAKIVNNYDGKNVKIAGNPAIWFIQKGIKKVYPNWETYLSFRGRIMGFTEFARGSEEADALLKVPSGDNMDITKSTYYQFIINEIKSIDDKDYSLWIKLDELYMKDKMGLLLT